MGKGRIKQAIAGAVLAGTVVAGFGGIAGAEVTPVRRVGLPPKVIQVAPWRFLDLKAETMTDRMTAMVNEVRAQGRSCGDLGYFPPAPPLVANTKLAAAAQAHSADMAAHDLFGHTGSNGSEPGQRIKAAGYQWKVWAENVAGGYAGEQATVDQWFASDGHCKNFMSKDLRDIGFGRAENPGSTYKTYWTADLGRQ